MCERTRVSLTVGVVWMALAAALVWPAVAPAASWSGTVRDEAGRGLANVEVRVYVGDTETGAVSDSAIASTMTAAGGTYRIDSVDATYVVMVFLDKTNSHRDGIWEPPMYSGRLIQDAPHWWSTSWLNGKTRIDHLMPSAAWFVANRVHRTAGADRYQTAVLASRNNFPAARDVVLVGGANFADGLAAAPWAGLHDAPVLLTPVNRAPSAVIAEIKRLGKAAGTPNPKIWIIGGPASVSSDVVAQLKGAGLTNISRFSGADRYAVAAGVAKACQAISYNKEPFLVRGDTFQDALALSPYAYMEGRPVLLTKPSGLPSATKNAWAAMKGPAENVVFAVGGPASITDKVLLELDRMCAGGLLLPNGDSIYLPGGDRYATPVALEKFYRVQFWQLAGGFDKLAVASGDVFADALAGSAAAGYNSAPILLTNKTGLYQSAGLVVLKNNVFLVDVEVFGGPVTLPAQVFRGIYQNIGTCWVDYDDGCVEVPVPRTSFPKSQPRLESGSAPAVQSADDRPGQGAPRLSESGLVRPLSR